MNVKPPMAHTKISTPEDTGDTEEIDFLHREGWRLPYYRFFAVQASIRASALFRFSSELATLKRR